MENFYLYESKIGKILIETFTDYIPLIKFVTDEEIENIQFSSEKTEIYEKIKKWFDIYFSGKEPDFKPFYMAFGNTFEVNVWSITAKIPYGTTVTYSDIAETYAKKHNLEKVSPRAVARALHTNPIAIVIPCHRVIGKNKRISGYAYGIDKKLKLLELEGVNVKELK